MPDDGLDCRVQTEGRLGTAGVQVHPCSTWQVFEQPSVQKRITNQLSKIK